MNRWSAAVSRSERDQPQHTRLFNTLRLVPLYRHPAALRFMIPTRVLNR